MKTCALEYSDYVYRVYFHFLTSLRSGISRTLSPRGPRSSKKAKTAPLVVAVPVPICRPFRKKMSSLSGVTIRASLSPTCREGKKKGEDITLVPELNHMAKDSMILRGGYCSCYRVDKLECSSTQCPVNTAHVQLVNNNGTPAVFQPCPSQ